MNEQDPDNSWRHRKRLPYDWEVRRDRRRRIAGRLALAAGGLALIAIFILLFR